MSIKQKVNQKDLSNAFRNEQGAIDLASIMVGIIVIGLIGGVIAATIFAVIPWAQDNAAKQQLDSVVAAQSAFAGLEADAAKGLNTAGFTYSAGGTNHKKIVASTGEVLFDGTDANLYITSYNQDGKAYYIAAAKSASGNIFLVRDTKTQPGRAETATNNTAEKVVRAAFPPSPAAVENVR
jgi:hypothetical protein